MKSFSNFVAEETSAKKPKATHTVHVQKVQYGYWGQTPYNDKIRKIKVHADNHEDAIAKATYMHPSIGPQMYKTLRNGDKTRYTAIKVEKH